MLTQCPSCKTVFNVKPEQLGAAQGKVRCSRCQSIFNARENLYTAPAAPTAEDKPVGQNTAQPVPTPPASPPAKAETKKPAAVETKPAPPASPAPASQSATPGMPETDEWFDLTPSPASKPKPAVEKKVAGKAPASVKPTPPPVEEPAVSVEDELTEDLFRLFDDPTTSGSKTEAPEPEQIVLADINTESPPSEAHPASAEPHKSDSGKEKKKRERSGAEKGDAEKKGKKASPGSYSLPPQLESRPVRATMRTLFYGMSILMLIAALLVQYGYNHRIPLRENPTLRPWLDALCQLTNCPMPPKRDPGKIELVDNMMQSHPRYQNSLLVTATLINRADYPQPYPIVEITMTDLDQHVVAQRTFRPEEYLAGDFAGMSFTPNVEVPLMLELSDPGDSAVGFKFDFY